MIVRVDTDEDKACVELTLWEATLLASAMDDFLSCAERPLNVPERSKEIAQGLVEGLQLRPPTTIEKTINLTTDAVLKGGD